MLEQCHRILHVCISLPYLSQQGQHWFSEQNTNTQVLRLYIHNQKALLSFPTAPIPKLFKHQLKFPGNLLGVEHKPLCDQGGESSEKFNNIQPHTAEYSH